MQNARAQWRLKRFKYNQRIALARMSVRAQASKMKKRAATPGEPSFPLPKLVPPQTSVENDPVSPDIAETRSIRNIAHDFNNLLTLVLGYGEALLKSLPEGHPGRAFADEICRAAREGERLSMELSSIARVQERGDAAQV